MLSNKEIAQVFSTTGKLLDLHGKDENRAKIFGAISFTIERLEKSVSALEDSEILAIRGLGKSTLAMVKEILHSGTTKELEELISITPEGVFELFKVNGLGVKKIKVLWEELGIDNLNELRIACENGKIAGTKGFGQKTQDNILASLAFLTAQSGKLRMDKAEALAQVILEELKKVYNRVELTGQVITANETVDTICFIVELDAISHKKNLPEIFLEDMQKSGPFVWRGKFNEQQVGLQINFCTSSTKVLEEFYNTASSSHLTYNKSGISLFEIAKSYSLQTIQEAYEKTSLPYIPPELRHSNAVFNFLERRTLQDLISWEDIKGTVHNHSTYSDGVHTLKEMAEACLDMGLSYFGIADHSQTATYANGLLPNQVRQQWDEVDKLNSGWQNFKIFKGIESDILSDGSLDYEASILSGFDYVVASVHSGLKMNLDVATARLLKAIENPYTTILGHLSGRLLLSREAYPLDYKKIIDACAANNVVMELNASPYRLDIDWRWIEYCMEKEVSISINPDAHSTEGLYDMRYGVRVARKGFLTRELCFNAKSLHEIDAFFKAKKK